MKLTTLYHQHGLHIQGSLISHCHETAVEHWTARPGHSLGSGKTAVAFGSAELKCPECSMASTYADHGNWDSLGYSSVCIYILQKSAFLLQRTVTTYLTGWSCKLAD